MNAQELLEQLTDAYARRDLLNIEKEQARNDAIPEEVEAALADIDFQFSPKLEILGNLIGRLEAQAKEAALSEGKTVNGDSEEIDDSVGWLINTSVEDMSSSLACTAYPKAVLQKALDAVNERGEKTKAKVLQTYIKKAK